MQSPFIEFSRDAWREYRQDTPLTLTEADLDKLRGYNDPVSLTEVEEIYLPLSRLLNMYVEAHQGLYAVTSEFLGHPEPSVPYIIGVSGSVAVGKSTTSRILQALLSRWPSHPNVALVTTDGFLYPNAELEQRGLMQRKGFPESFNIRALLDFLYDVKSGKENVKAPIYSHEIYDIVPDKFLSMNKPDVVIVEGLNVLQVGTAKEGKIPSVFVSDFFDFSLYVDADINVVKKWFLDRFFNFKEAAKTNPDLFMHQFAMMPDDQAAQLANYFWHEINEANYIENIEPYKHRARCLLQKAQDHCVQTIRLRKI